MIDAHVAFEKQAKAEIYTAHRHTHTHTHTISYDFLRHWHPIIMNISISSMRNTNRVGLKDVAKKYAYICVVFYFL